VDIFKLPGDSLTATTATEHSIPTPSIPKGRAITLRNYRLPEAQQHEVNEQVTQMLKDKIIIPSKSEWNFPLIVVPKKMDASGKKKWRICIDFRKLNEYYPEHTVIFTGGIDLNVHFSAAAGL
jgi:hypothetical protein